VTLPARVSAHAPQFSSSPSPYLGDFLSDLSEPWCLLHTASARKPLCSICSLAALWVLQFSSRLITRALSSSYSSVVFKHSTSNSRLVRFFAQARLFLLSLFSPLPLSLGSLFLLSAPFRPLLSLCSRSLLPLCVCVLCVCVCGARREQGSSHTFQSGAPHHRLGCLSNVQVLRMCRTR